MVVSRMTSAPVSTLGRFRAAALALGLGATLVLAGCGAANDEQAPKDDASETTSTESETPAEDASADDETADAQADSAAEVTIDGEPVDIPDPTVVCQEADGQVTIAVGSMTGTDGLGAVLSSGDSPTVTSVALGSVDGTAMGWAEGAPGEVSATKDGSSYTISGSMMAVDASDPTAADETPFEMGITCP